MVHGAGLIWNYVLCKFEWLIRSKHFLNPESHPDLPGRVLNPLSLVNLLHLLLHVLHPLLKQRLGRYLHDQFLLQSSDCIIIHQTEKFKTVLISKTQENCFFGGFKKHIEYKKVCSRLWNLFITVGHKFFWEIRKLKKSKLCFQNISLLLPAYLALLMILFKW